MADTYTTNLNLTKPEPGAAEDTWGISLNADLDALDAIFSSSGTQINLNPNQINFADNKKAIFGTGGDLEIFHTGSSSIIKDSGTGSLSVRGTHLNLADSGGNIFIEMTDTGVGGTVEIKHNAATKLATTSTGIDVTGVITTDGLTTSGNINFGDNDKAVFGAGSDLEIYHDGSNSFIKDVGSGDLIIQGSNAIRLRSSTGENMAIFNADGAATLQYDNSTKLQTTSTGIDVTGIVENDGLRVDSTDSIRPTGDTSLITISGGNATNSGANYTLFGGTHATLANIHRWRIGGSEAARIDASGNLMVGKTSVGVSTTGSEIRADGQVSIVREYATPLYINRKSSDGDVVDFRKDNSTFGTIRNSGTNLIISGFGTNKSGLYFGDNALFPVKNGSLSNSTIGFGSPNYRFTDLYLSGGHMNGQADSFTFVSGGNASNAGANILLYGQSHASVANTTVFRASGSETARIDSSGNFGIGVTPAAKLDVLAGGDQRIIFGTLGTDPFINAVNAANSSYKMLQLNGSVMRLMTGGSERARIDSSGNFLVAQTTQSPNTVGISLNNNGNISAKRNDGIVGLFNRGTSDGEIISIRKDDATIGKISTYSSGLDIAGSSYGVRFAGSTVFPVTSAGSVSNGAVDLGYSSGKFKDLYLSGTVKSTTGLELTDGTSIYGNVTESNGSLTLNARNTGILLFQSGGNEKARIDSSGRFGIGTTSPDSKLHVDSGVSSTSDWGNLGIISDFPINVANRIYTSYLLQDSEQYKGAGIGLAYDGTGYKMHFATASSPSSGISTQMTIDRNGNLGIGTTSPTGKIHVKSGSTPSIAQLLIGYNNTSINYFDANTHIFRNGSSQEKARIDSSGNLLVGTTTVSLYNNSSEVGTRIGDGVLMVNRSANTPAYFNRLSTNGAVIQFRKGGTAVGDIAVTSSATTYNTSSDARLKDVTGQARGLDVINALNPVSYNWKADGKADEGLIAQEVQEIVPNAVSQNEDQYYQMDYSKLVVHLVKGMKEQQEQIESLKSEIANLKGE